MKLARCHRPVGSPRLNIFASRMHRPLPHLFYRAQSNPVKPQMATYMSRSFFFLHVGTNCLDPFLEEEQEDESILYLLNLS